MRLKTYGNCDKKPTDWEQDVAEIYVNCRILARPTTNIKTALIFFLLFVFATVFFTWVIYFFSLNGIYKFIPYNVKIFHEEQGFLSIFLLCLIIIFMELIFCIKHLLISMIMLYQHYAPEEIRRRCLFMPTCSEYAIMAIKKYGVIRGLYKSYFRLFYRCRGNIYQIDYP